MRRSKDRYGADVGETGSGEPGERTALRARSNDVDLIHELPYGPAACEPPQQRPDTWQHPIQRRSCSKILLAPEGASTHASQGQQQGRWRWHAGARLRLGQQGIPLGFDSLDLFDHELEPIELPADLGLQALRKGATIARDQLLKPLPAVSVQGLVVADPLGEQKPLDAVDVLDPFGRQRLALPTDPAPILLLGVGAWTIAHTRGSPRL